MDDRLGEKACCNRENEEFYKILNQEDAEVCHLLSDK
jgi:hypothetical protein